MIIRHDRVAVDLPSPAGPNANGAAAVQELPGGKFGEMSTLMNYTFQSMNFRGRDARHARPPLVGITACTSQVSSTEGIFSHQAGEVRLRRTCR